MDSIITYDIKRNHTEIKDDLKALGYKDTIKGVDSNGNAAIQQLPNTTLIKYDKTPSACRDEVKKVINDNNGGIDRIFCAQLAENFDWSGV